MKCGTLGIGPVNICAIAGLASALVGCAVHPLPQDVTRASTVQIVARIRCEAKEGLEAALTKAAAEGPAKKRHVEKIVDGTSIGFEFKFKMTESNSLTADSIEFEREAAKSGDRFKLVLVGALNDGHGAEPRPTTRKNERQFRVVDDLKELKDARCRRAGTAGPNLLYPISGSTGMADVVRTYIELEALTDLTGSLGPTGKMMTFTDDIDFTTTFETGATVNLEFNTGVGTLRLTKVVGADLFALRQDVHSVKVVLARDKDRELD